MITDQLGREFRSLRVSLTTACNLACTYCVPEGGRPRCEVRELSVEKTAYAVQLLCSVLGIKKVRLTGGEPLISRKLYALLPELKRLKIPDISLTTNGQILAEKAAFLGKHGIRRINVSLDTISPDRFAEITRGGDLNKTLRGMEVATAVGMRVKVNMIPMNPINIEEIVPVLDYCLERGYELRYIELMRMGHLADPAVFEKKFVPMSHLLQQIEAKYTVVPEVNHSSDTAKRYSIPGIGKFGIIANDSAPFCHGCDRLRLTSEGDLLGCISSHKTFSIRELLQTSSVLAKEQLQKKLLAALATKRNDFFHGTNNSMSSLGG